MDRRVEEAIARFRLLPRAEHHRVAAGPYEAQAVLLLAEPPLTVEARYLASVAHLPGQGAFLALHSVAEERGREADERVKIYRKRDPGAQPYVSCGRLCVLVNQGPCRCVVPKAVAELRRRQRALLWAAEAIMRNAKPRICSICLCSQIETRSGWTCQNGHGGAEPVA